LHNDFEIAVASRGGVTRSGYYSATKFGLGIVGDERAQIEEIEEGKETSGSTDFPE
jgi:hypothetical protein